VVTGLEQDLHGVRQRALKVQLVEVEYDMVREDKEWGEDASSLFLVIFNGQVRWQHHLE